MSRHCLNMFDSHQLYTLLPKTWSELGICIANARSGCAMGCEKVVTKIGPGGLWIRIWISGDEPGQSSSPVHNYQDHIIGLCWSFTLIERSCEIDSIRYKNLLKNWHPLGIAFGQCIPFLIPLIVLALSNVISLILPHFRPVKVLSSVSQIPFHTMVSFVMDLRYDEFSKGWTICWMALRYLLMGLNSFACSSEHQSVTNSIVFHPSSLSRLSRVES